MKNCLLILSVSILTLFSARAQRFEWAVGQGSQVQDEGKAIATDVIGNVYSTGVFRYTADFDPGAGTAELSSSGDNEIYVQKLNAKGEFVWAKQLGGSGWEYARAIAVDANGNVYVAGNYNGTADFDPNPQATSTLTAVGGDDIFVVKLNSSGNLVWAKSMGGNTTDEAYSLAVDGSGNVYATGRFQGTADFDPGAGTANLTVSGSSDDIFLCKLDASGNYVWAKQIGGGGNDFGMSAALNRAGSAVYLAGYYWGSVDFDPGAPTLTLAAMGASDVFVAKFSTADGALQWAKGVGGSGYDLGYAVAVDEAENVYYTGAFESTVDFNPDATGTDELASAGGADIFIAKLSASGNYMWAKRFGSAMPEWGQAIATDIENNIYCTGFFQGTVDFDPGTGVTELVSAGGEDVFVGKFNAAGVMQWAGGMGGANAMFGDRGQAITVSNTGDVLTTGWFYDSGDFDPGSGTTTLTSQGSFDIFVHKFSQPITGVQETISDNSLHISPNPAGAEITVSLPEGATYLTILDALGKTVMTRELPLLSGYFRCSVADLPIGVYSVRVLGQGVMQTGMFIRP